MKKYISNLKYPVDLFTVNAAGINQTNRYVNFRNLLRNSRRDPDRIAVINYDVCNGSENVRIATKPDDIQFAKMFVPVREDHIGWPLGNGIITDNPDITLVNNHPDAVYFYDYCNGTVVGTAVCNPFTVTQQGIIKKIIERCAEYGCPPNHISLEYPQHFARLTVKSFIDEGIKNLQIIYAKNSQKSSMLLCWKPKKGA